MGWGLDYEGIGIGCPGPLDFAGGRILNPPNLPGWEGFPVAEFFRERCGHRCLLNNDANVAGLAEARVGAGAGFASVVYMSVSTGVGAAYVADGRIVGGAHSLATEVFNMIVCDAQSARPGMNPGALEDQSSGTAIARMASRRMGRDVAAPEVFALADGGDADALALRPQPGLAPLLRGDVRGRRRPRGSGAFGVGRVATWVGGFPPARMMVAFGTLPGATLRWKRFGGDMAQDAYEYDATICEAQGKGGAYVPFPWDIRKELGRGRVKVHVEFDGIPYDGSVVNMGVKNPDGSVCYIVGMLKAIRMQLDEGPGDTVHVVVTERE